MERVQKEAVKIGTTAIGSTVSSVINVCLTNSPYAVTPRSSKLSMTHLIALVKSPDGSCHSSLSAVLARSEQSAQAVK